MLKQIHVVYRMNVNLRGRLPTIRGYLHPGLQGMQEWKIVACLSLTPCHIQTAILLALEENFKREGASNEHH